MRRVVNAVVDLGEEARPVHGIVFTVGDGAWPDDASVEVSLDGETWESIDAHASLADATLSLYRDPRQGRGAVRFAPVEARLVRIDRARPMRPGTREVLP